MNGGTVDNARPAMPDGRYVMLPGRGRTFIREVAGPPGAPTLVLLHGWTATADLNWFACFEPLAEHFRVVAPDHRGHGRGLHTDEPFRLADCADDVAALVDQLDLDVVIPVGYSMGGPIAQLLWRRHPELVSAVVLCATSCRFSGTLRERVLFATAAGTSVLADTVPVARLTHSALAAWNSWRNRRGNPWWGLDEIARHDWAHIIEAGRELGRFDSRHWSGDIDVPTAVVVTEHDDVVPAHRQHELVSTLRDPWVRSVAGGHAVCTSDPSQFVPALLAACHAVAQPSVTVAA